MVESEGRIRLMLEDQLEQTNLRFEQQKKEFEDRFKQMTKEISHLKDQVEEEKKAKIDAQKSKENIYNEIEDLTKTLFEVDEILF